MQELSLNVLDVAQNSLSAGASLVEITVAYTIQLEDIWLDITIADNGWGMDEATAARVADPFFTTRTTRGVGLGIPLFKMAAELTGGSFSLQSAVGEGTTVSAHILASHIDAMPLGDMAATYVSLVQTNPQRDFVYLYSVSVAQRPEINQEFTSDTRQFKEILEGVPLDIPSVLSFIKAYIEDNTAECSQLLAQRLN